MSGAPTPADPRDPRVDRAITWALTTVATLAFAIGGWQFETLATEVRLMRADLSSISTRVAVMEAAKVSERIDRLEERVRAMERTPPR